MDGDDEVLDCGEYHGEVCGIVIESLCVGGSVFLGSGEVDFVARGCGTRGAAEDGGLASVVVVVVGWAGVGGVVAEGIGLDGGVDVVVAGCDVARS